MMPFSPLQRYQGCQEASQPKIAQSLLDEIDYL
jgi:hypothetical protein